jgi:hypothetical protein
VSVPGPATALDGDEPFEVVHPFADCLDLVGGEVPASGVVYGRPAAAVHSLAL